MDDFWTNSIWYLLLAAIALLEVIFALAKAERRKFAFAYYLTISGMVVIIFEQVVYLFTRGYDYYPKLISGLPLYDNLLGKVISQLSVSATAFLVAVFHLNLFWILILATLYGIIEQSFVAIGNYQQYWYRSWMTVVSLAFYFGLARLYYRILMRGVSPIVHYINMFAGLFTLWVCSPVPWAFALSGIQCFVPVPSIDPFIGTIVLINGFFIVLVVPAMIIYYLKPGGLWSAAVALALCGVTYWAYRYLNLLWLKNDGWFLIFFSTHMLWIYGSIVVLDNFYKSLYGFAARPKIYRS